MTNDYQHCTAALQYAKDVVAKRIPASKLTRLACKRHIDDLKKKYHPVKWPYVFDPRKGERVCRFIEKLVHIKGEWAGQRIKLEPWQSFYFTTKHGWIYKDNGYRRFRTSYLEVPRKNAKSTMSAGEMLYMCSADGEQGAECYSAATTKKQARIVFDTAQKMAKKAPDLLAAYRIRVRANDIIIDGTDSVAEPVSAEADNLDGLNIHFASVDELHAHKTRAVYDVIETGCGARAQSMLSIITTSGTDTTGICYELRDYLVKVLEKVFDDESFFGIIYTVDEGDDEYGELAFRKANPNYGISVKKEYLANLAKKAKRSIASRANFFTKHLDIWARSDTAWMDMQKYRKCASIATAISDFKGHKCTVGLDLSSKIDIAALVLVFYRDDLWYVFCKFYLPEDTVEEKEDTTANHYKTWAQQGWLTLTPGNVIDYDVIEEDLKKVCKEFKVESVGFDPWQATQLANNMTKLGIPMVEVGNNVKNFSEPMKQIDALVRQNKLRPGGNPVLQWMMSNVVAHLDKKDNIYPNKERPQNKIDGVIALIIAISRAIFQEPSKPSIYENGVSLSIEEIAGNVDTSDD